MDITPLREHALLLRRKIYQVQLKLADEVYKIKQEETRLQEISIISIDFRERTLEITEIIQGQLIWLETNAEFLENVPQKSTKNFNIEYELMEKCMDFYKGCLQFITYVIPLQQKRLQEFPGQ